MSEKANTDDGAPDGSDSDDDMPISSTVAKQMQGTETDRVSSDNEAAKGRQMSLQVEDASDDDSDDDIPISAAVGIRVQEPSHQGASTNQEGENGPVPMATAKLGLASKGEDETSPKNGDTKLPPAKQAAAATGDDSSDESDDDVPVMPLLCSQPFKMLITSR